MKDKTKILWTTRTLSI